jgi:multicomponent Na+:H+ antiporter subunit A
VQVLAVGAAALTFAYIGRFWLGIFTGAPGAAAERISPLLVAPVGVLAAAAVVGGIAVGPFANLAADAAAVTRGAPVQLAPAYHAAASAQNLMALAAWAVGIAALALPRVREPLALAVAHAGDRLGPRHWYGVALHGLNRLSNRLHDAELRDLRMSIAAVLVPGGVLIAIAFAVTPTRGAYDVGGVALADVPIVVVLALAVLAGVTTARDKGRLRATLALSVLGFALAAVYAMVGAADVALVAVVVETVYTLVFVGVFSRLPPPRHRPEGRWRARRNLAAGVVAGAGAFATIWSALSRPTAGGSVSAEHIRRAPAAHGGDVVTVILADFRGLDTLVEITVLAVAMVGVAALLRGGRPW